MLKFKKMSRRSVVVGSCALGMLAVAAAVATPLINTQLNDFYFYGPQPYSNVPNNPNFDPLLEPENCASCHQDFSGEQPAAYSVPYNRWAYTMMAQSWRDPIFQAQFDIAEKDAPFSGDSCMRCHAPAGWIQGRGNLPGQTTPSRGENFDFSDRHGVSCIVCHRMVDPVPDPANPPVDAAYYAHLGANLPPNFPAQGLTPGGPVNSNSFLLDNRNNRRGPFDPSSCYHGDTYESPFHKESQLCAGCHDVSNPVYVKQNDGSYLPSPMGQPHPTGNKYDMYPMDRTFSEWLMSAYAQPGGVTLTVPNPNPGDSPAVVGRYSYDGITKTPATPENPSKIVIFNSNVTYTSCQSCHMPPTAGYGADPNIGAPFRENAPVHNFTGANSWVLKSVFDVWGPAETLMTEPALVQESVDRNNYRMTQASDMELSLEGGLLKVRIVNNCGHKLPGGFAEGRRMWINVKFKDAQGNVVSEIGGYDTATATISEAGTKVYELIHGVDANISVLTGLPVGKSFHIDINNKVFKDNRIPPRGFDNANFEAVQSPPVGYSYADGQHWDDTLFALPPGAVTAEVQVLHQTTGRDYAEFLRDNATTIQDANNPNSMPQPGPLSWTAPPGTPPSPLTMGQIAYAQWIKWGKSTPVVMDSSALSLVAAGCNAADIACDDGIPLAQAPGCVNSNFGPNEGDYNAFFAADGFFFQASQGVAAVGSFCDIACDDGTPLAEAPGCVNNGVNEGDYNAFFNNLFLPCP